MEKHGVTSSASGEGGASAASSKKQQTIFDFLGPLGVRRESIESMLWTLCRFPPEVWAAENADAVLGGNFWANHSADREKVTLYAKFGARCWRDELHQLVALLCHLRRSLPRVSDEQLREDIEKEAKKTSSKLGSKVREYLGAMHHNRDQGAFTRDWVLEQAAQFAALPVGNCHLRASYAAVALSAMLPPSVSVTWVYSHKLGQTYLRLESKDKVHYYDPLLNPEVVWDESYIPEVLQRVFFQKKDWRERSDTEWPICLKGFEHKAQLDQRGFYRTSLALMGVLSEEPSHHALMAETVLKRDLPGMDFGTFFSLLCTLIDLQVPAIRLTLASQSHQEAVRAFFLSSYLGKPGEERIQEEVKRIGSDVIDRMMACSWGQGPLTEPGPWRSGFVPGQRRAFFQTKQAPVGGEESVELLPALTTHPFSPVTVG